MDLAFRSPLPAISWKCKDDPSFCAQYAQGVEKLFAEVRTAIQPGLLFFNGIFTSEPAVPFEDQVKLLDHADGVAVEYFGLDPLRQKSRGNSSFRADILPYLDAIAAHPKTVFLVFGRGPWLYSDYREDYLWQRYLYASYLLGAGKNTFFKYHSTFQIPTHYGRAGGMDLYADWDPGVGSPLGPFRREGELYSRRFSKGLAVAAPHEGKGGQYRLAKPMFDPEGNRRQGRIELRPGEGLILLNKRPAETRFRLDPGSGRFAEWAAIEREGNGNRFLRISRAPAGEEYEYDLLLDPVRRWTPPAGLRLRVRSNDAQAQLICVAEVDDPQHKQMRAGLVVAGMSSSAQQTSVIPAVIFRTPSSSARMAAAGSSQVLSTDGKWQTVTVNGEDAFKDYAFRRWVHIRPVGDLDIADVELF
jgi:hypothetical protein